MSKHVYTIEARNDHKLPWRFQARFKEGEPSRWGIPFTLEVMMKEVEGFVDVRRKDFAHVRLVIELC